jgi:predicted nucleotidyltransferase
MRDEQIVSEIKRIILKQVGKDMVSLYIIGSFVTKDATRESDIDLIGIVNSGFDFRKETLLNSILNKDIPDRKIDLGTISYAEFFGGKHKGSITKHIELPAFMAFLKHAKLICGKRLNFNKFPIQPMSLKEELRYHIETFDWFKNKFRNKDSVRHDFTFRDFIKIIFYIADIELHLVKHKLGPKRGYSDIERAFKSDRNHIVHYSLKLRHKADITNGEKQRWLDKAEIYVDRMRLLL